MLYKICSTILFLTLAQLSFAQKGIFFDYLRETNVTYHKPKAYSVFEWDKREYVPARDPSSVFFYFIHNEKKDILIGFTLAPLMTKAAFKSDISSFVIKNPNDNIINTAKAEAGVNKSKIYYYNLKELRKNNAGKALKYDLNILTPFLGKYEMCKVLLIQRDDISTCGQYYFYNRGSEKYIDKEIKRNSGVLIYLPDSLYKPQIFK